MLTMVFNPDWEHVLAEASRDDMLDLGERILADVQDHCPVKTGYLLSTTYMDVDEMTGVIEIGATADYAEQVEDREPFLRPAVYRSYGDLL